MTTFGDDVRLFPWQSEAETEGLETHGAFLVVVEGIVVGEHGAGGRHGCVGMGGALCSQRVGGEEGDGGLCLGRGFPVEDALEG